ncbi:Hypothetical Protein FCC1311_108012 [Hondaea fermentalgiana]|uniref:Uncharacterized protein n=1 Tax=Hondaea fermentalgiana TaxID=2315210 RepID=A0A2R5GUR0_9STRA|nr:Hypothetical Protein FCC1311_108012 [Hondaea fermentalgiana]|eukprot:GBG34580.1 Hypothetical Protein FCC1311_108012 [Hondaea fermentalgiana]
MDGLIALGAGTVFGFALDKAHTNVPMVISQQMEMRDFTMMRMFLTASSTSAAVVLALHALGLKERKAERGTALGFNMLGGYGANLVGGFLLGAGMYLSGSCPGTVWAQIGAGMPFTMSILAGGLLGAITFGYLERLGRKNPDFLKRNTPEESDLIPSFLPYAIGSIAFVAMGAGVLAALDTTFPWQDSQARILAAAPPFANYEHGKLDAQYWDPALAGLLLGLLQIPVQLSSGKALGQSSGWVLIASYIAGFFDRNLDKNAPYLTAVREERKPLFQVIVSTGIMAGAALSQYLSGYPMLAPTYANGAGSNLNAFLGGFLLLLGARLGGGCTSGHGLSGMAQLSIASLITVAGMFAGGMIFAAASGNFAEIKF